MKKLGYWSWRILLALFALLLLYQLWIFAHICWWVKFNPSASAFMEDRLAVMQDKNPDAELRHQWVTVFARYILPVNNLFHQCVFAQQ